MRKIFKFIGLLLLLIICVILSNHLMAVDENTITHENEIISLIEERDSQISCVIKPVRRKYKIGEAPKLEVGILNNTDSSIVMLGSLDGSEYGMRLPVSYFKISHQMFGNTNLSKRTCGNINPLLREEFVSVAPKEVFNPFAETQEYSYFSSSDLESINFLLPGKYTIKYYYSTKQKNSKYLISPGIQKIDATLKQWHIENGKEEILLKSIEENRILDSLWKLVPKIDLESNTVTIEYNL